MILSEKQKEFIRNANHRFNIKVGARRCGKTYLDNLYVIPKRILERKGKDGLYCILRIKRYNRTKCVATIKTNIWQFTCWCN